jgi:glycosyltransferase involved in cell wall biosynthesis
MRLLIVTQAVDLDDPVLGFFHGWIQEFAKKYEQVSVICLKEGRHELPSNVSVYSLGKERGASRIKYLVNFYRYIWTLRHQYDGVFVHMNQEYVLLGWKIWWILGKRVVLWRNHKKGSIFTRIAALVSHTVCYTSPEAYLAGYGNAIQMPIGIDTELFKASAQAPDPRTILFLGRLDPVKKCEIFIEALEKLRANGVAFHADIVGDPTAGNERYAHDIRNKAGVIALDGALTMKPGVLHAQTPALYASHAIYVNLTPSGSFDKTIGEAMASGCVMVVSNEAVREVIGDHLMVTSAESAASALTSALSLSGDERVRVSQRNREYVIDQHSLMLLSNKVATLFL